MAGRRVVGRGRLNDDYGNSFSCGRNQGVQESSSLMNFIECTLGFASEDDLQFTIEEGQNVDFGRRLLTSLNEGRGRVEPAGGSRRFQQRPAVQVAAAGADDLAISESQIARGRGGRAGRAGRGSREGRGRGRVGGGDSEGAEGADFAGNAALAARLNAPSSSRRAPRSGAAGDSCTRGRTPGTAAAASAEGNASNDVQESDAQQRDKSTKGKNFSPEEERQLTRSVISISQDSVTGNGQKATAFWDRICKHYNDRRPLQYRPMRSLESKWGHIKHNVSKYIAVLQQCTNLNVSGASAKDVQHKALELYRFKSPKNAEFTYLHVWELVKDIPRWNVDSALEKSIGPSIKRKEVPSESESTYMEPNSSPSLDAGGGSSCGSKNNRPIGSKRAKLQRLQSIAAVNTEKQQALATKAMADATLRKSQVMDDHNIFMLMTQKVDGVMSETAMEYLILRQKEEFLKLKARFAEQEARTATLENCPPPIPVETPEALQHRVETVARTV